MHMIEKFQKKKSYTIDDLLNIMALLRSPDGCPWDRVQTHESIRKSFIEETYEVIEAIDKQDTVLLCEELGDVLLQVIFHAQMEAENGTFTFDDVVNGLAQKLVERHPHVFGDVVADTPQAVSANWEKIKSQTKQRHSVSDKMDAVPRQLPALMRAQKIQKAAAKVGFDWDAPDGALQKVQEERLEVENALQNKDRENLEEEIGDLLFSAVNVARLCHVDAEEALTRATDKFQGRFSKVETLAKARGISMPDEPLEVLDKLWDEVKTEESK